MKHTAIKSTIGVSLALATLVGSVGVAAAAPNTASTESSNTTVALSTQLSKTQEDKLADELQVLFTRYIQLESDGLFKLNEANLQADGYAEQAENLQRLVGSLNISENSLAINETFRSTHLLKSQSSGSYIMCVILEGLGIPAAGASPELVKAIKEGIRAWNWGLTAKTVAKIIGSSAAKALGGPIGIGVALGWAAWTCWR